jgi:hypothetical protein
MGTQGVVKMIIQQDGKEQIFVEWNQGPNGAKRAWIRHASPDTDWAGTGRYANVVRIDRLGAGPAGQSTDFPIFNDLPDQQVLISFVAAVCGITGCPIP